VSDRISFKGEIFICGKKYRKYILKALVRHQGIHFTCAVSDLIKTWSYINVFLYRNLNELYGNYGKDTAIPDTKFGKLTSFQSFFVGIP